MKDGGMDKDVLRCGEYGPFWVARFRAVGFMGVEGSREGVGGE